MLPLGGSFFVRFCFVLYQDVSYDHGRWKRKNNGSRLFLPGSKIFSLFLCFLSKILSLYEVRHLLIKEWVQITYNDDGRGKRNHIPMHYKYALSLCPSNHGFSGSWEAPSGRAMDPMPVFLWWKVILFKYLKKCLVSFTISGNHFNHKKIFHPVFWIICNVSNNILLPNSTWSVFVW